MTELAQRVQDRIMKAATDEEARLYAAMVAGAAIQHDLEAHHDVFQHTLDKVVAKRAQTLSKALSRTVISKAQGGGEVDELVRLGEAISKAAWDETDINRDPKGRFSRVESRARISYFNTPPLPRRHAERMGVPSGSHTIDDQTKLKGRDKAAFQQAYAQVAAMVSPYANLTDDSVLQLTYVPKSGSPYTKTVDMPKTTKDGRVELSSLLKPKDFQNGDRLVEAAVRTSPTLSIRGAAFDLAGSLGGSGAGIAASRAFPEKFGDRAPGVQPMSTFATEWNKEATDAAAGNRGGIFRRFSAASRLLNDVLGDYAPERLKMAVAAGDLVGQYGAEAEKVIGPAADRAAYRYRGVEKKPDPVLQRTIEGYRRRFPDENSARNALIYGRKDETAVGGHKNPRVAEDGTVLSPLVYYFKERLAKPERLELQRASGVIPPSQGVIIDRDGKVVTEAVGYGEDWYLPFNLRTLGMVNGGEYVRTRAWGGPTTEDVYAGLVSGARASTVVSNHGVYTIEFDPAFRGTRRYSDKAARMVKRYGNLLDAVKSRQVTVAGVPDDRMAELREQAMVAGDPRGTKPERDAFKDKLNQLVADERTDPQMSEARRKDLAVEFLEDKALDLPGGHASSWTDFARNHVDRQVKAAENGPWPEQESDVAGVRARAQAEVDTPEKVARTVGFGEEFDRYMAVQENKYRNEQSPLNLDGQGYYRALEALQEQFPYYISNVSYTPFAHGTQDPGYVKPRYTRPEMALSGYFDPTIEGAGKQQTITGEQTGKVTADQTRWQAGRDPRRAEPRFGSRTRKDEDAARESDLSSTGGTSPTPGGSTDVQAFRDQESVLNLWRHLHSKKTAVIERGDKAGQGRQNPAKFDELFPLAGGRSEEEIRREASRDLSKVKEELLKEARTMGNAYIIDEKILDAVREPQAQKVGRPWSYAEAINDRNRMFDFGADFAQGQKEQYYVDKAARMARQLGVSDPSDDKALDKVIDDNHQIWLDSDKPYVTAEMARKAQDNVKKAVQIKVLRKRAEQAKKDEEDRKAAEKRIKEAQEAARKPNNLFFNVTPDVANDAAEGRITDEGLRRFMDESSR